MITKIQPITMFKFGAADTLLLRSTSDDLATNAQFYWQLGRTIPAVPATDDTPEVPESFLPSETAKGNAEIVGDNYAGWDGSNDAALALILPQIDATVQLA